MPESGYLTCGFNAPFPPFLDVPGRSRDECGTTRRVARLTARRFESFLFSFAVVTLLRDRAEAAKRLASQLKPVIAQLTEVLRNLATPEASVSCFASSASTAT